MIPRQKKRKSRMIFVKICFVIFMFVVLAIGYTMPQDVTIYSPDEFKKLEDGWVQYIADEEIALETIDQYVEIETGESIVIATKIREDMVGLCVLFYAEHQRVTATVAGEKVYELSIDGVAELFETPGRTWVSVPITASMVGEELVIEIMSVFGAYQGLPDTVYCVEEGAIFMVQVYAIMLRNTVAFILLGIAIFTYICAKLWKPKHMRHYLFAMADLYLVVGLWICAEANVLAIWVGRSLLSAVLGMILLRFIPVAVYQFFVAILPYDSWRTKLAKKLVWGNLFISVILQFVFAVPMLHLVVINMIVIILGSVLGLLEMLEYHRSGMQFLSYRFACYSAIILFVAVLIECYIYLNYQSYGQWMGVPLAVACILYYAIAYLSLLGAQSEVVLEKNRLDTIFANLHKYPLNQQINAHFLYNTLNTIGAYCKEDGDMAFEAIGLLGQYMRAYTKLVGADEYVALEEELELMQTYMLIQNMRFENSIIFMVQNSCEDVFLPPLTLQTLVENAVNHGIRKRKGGGEIFITGKYKYDMAEIIVSDNGVGFDIKNLDALRGVGLKNLESRIKAMGGSMKIQSVVGKGTDVTLKVPLVYKMLEDEKIDDFIC